MRASSRIFLRWMLCGLTVPVWIAPLGAHRRSRGSAAGSNSDARRQGGATARRKGRRRPCLQETSPPDAILVCDRDADFCESVRNFLLAAGYCRVEVVGTARDALLRLRQRSYRHVLIGMSQPFLRAWRLAWITRQRQREAKVLFLMEARDQPLVRDVSHNCVIKEYVFSTLLDVM